MSLLVIVLGLIVVLTAVIVVVVKRLSLNKESKKIVERMQNITLSKWYRSVGKMFQSRAAL